MSSWPWAAARRRGAPVQRARPGVFPYLGAWESTPATGPRAMFLRGHAAPRPCGFRVNKGFEPSRGGRLSLPLYLSHPPPLPSPFPSLRARAESPGEPVGLPPYEPRPMWAGGLRGKSCQPGAYQAAVDADPGFWPRHAEVLSRAERVAEAREDISAPRLFEFRRVPRA